MKRFSLAGIFLALCLSVVQSAPALSEAPSRFVAVDVYIESQAPVAAWQIEFSSRDGKVKVVGVENGESAVFGDAPYYDGQAISTGPVERLIVADFSLHPRDELPQGRFRIATLHLMVRGTGDPSFDTRLVVAADFSGTRIYPAISTQFSTGSKQ